MSPIQVCIVLVLVYRYSYVFYPHEFRIATENTCIYRYSSVIVVYSYEYSNVTVLGKKSMESTVCSRLSIPHDTGPVELLNTGILI